MLASLRGNAEATVEASNPPERLETSLELLDRVRAGDRAALERLCAIHLPAMARWATGRLPRWARDLLSTEDLVQETLLKTLQALGHFQPRHDGALQAYLRQALINRVRDEVRRITRYPTPGALEDDAEHADASASPLDEAIGHEAVERYESALQRLRPEEREVIIARVELQQSYAQIAAAHGKASADAARMAVTRALVRLAEEMDVER
jgi:RNA polymerase sigma-70 factor (ECF subfamily)